MEKAGKEALLINQPKKVQVYPTMFFFSVHQITWVAHIRRRKDIIDFSVKNFYKRYPKGSCVHIPARCHCAKELLFLSYVFFLLRHRIHRFVQLCCGIFSLLLY